LQTKELPALSCDFSAVISIHTVDPSFLIILKTQDKEDPSSFTERKTTHFEYSRNSSQLYRNGILLLSLKGLQDHISSGKE